jgi:heat shock protein HslJ
VSNFSFRKFCGSFWKASRVATAHGTILFSLVASASVVTGCTPKIHALTTGLYKISTGAAQTTSVDHLVFIVEPSNTAAQVAINPEIQIDFVNQSNQIDTSVNEVVSLAIGTNPSAGTLSGNITATAIGGIATFPGLSINNLGAGYTLIATASGVSTSTSTAFNISAGVPSKLVFVTEPASAVSGASLGNISVKIEDANGNLVTSSVAPITLTIGNNAGPGGTLSGSVTVNAVAGVATLPGLNIDVAGLGYTLVASSGLLAAATSTSFNISASVANKLAFTTQPASAASGASLGSIAVTVEDAAGNKISSSSAPITLAIGNNAGPGGILTGTLTVNAINGVATFPGLSINLDGTGYTLTATSASLTGATSSAFNITSGTASKLVFSTQPTNAASGASLGSVAVTVEDASGNKVTSSSASITLAIGNNAGPGGVLAGTLTVTAVSGVATFPGLSINLDGTGYTLTAAASSLTGATSSAFNITSSGASKLAFTTQPANATSGASLGSIAVSVEDADGNLVTSSSAPITLAIGNNAGPGGTLSGTVTVNAVSGVATFPGLNINLVGAGYTLTAASASLAGATSSAFNISAGTASKLAFSTQPSNAASGASLGSIAVTVEDAAGNKVTSSSANVTLAIGNNAGPGGVLSGTLTVAASSGVATFPGLSINVDGTGYTLYASSGGLGGLTGATSSAFNITSGAATKLVFTAQPSNASSGASLGSITVSVEDASGNVVTGSSAPVTLAIGNNAGPGGTLSGTLTVNAISGVASFSGLSIDVAGMGYSLGATSASLTSATSSYFNITAGAASQLVFTTQPSNAASGASLGSIAVKIEDAAGNLVTTSTAPVTLAIGTNAGPGGVLSGTATINAVSGVATLPGLNINLSGTGYTLTASSGALSGTISNTFNISAGPATQLVITNQPTNTVSAATIDSGTGVVVKVEDAAGNIVTTSSASVALAITSGPGTLSGTATVSASSGVATFSNLSINQIATGYALTATSSGLTSAVSSSFNITTGPPSQLVFTSEPTSAIAGASIDGAGIQVTVEDAGGNVVTGSSLAITIAMGSGPGTLNGTLTENAVAGVATFTGNWIDLMGSHTLRAFAPGDLRGTSASFTISPAAPSVLVLYGGYDTYMNGCDGGLTLVTQDMYTNVSPVTSNTSFAIASTGSTTFYNGTTCSGGPLAGSIPFNSGTSSVPFSLIDSAREGFTITASNTGFSSSSATLYSRTLPTMTAGASTIIAGACTQYTVTNQDALGNPVNVVAGDNTIVIGYYVPGRVLGFSDAGCTNPISTITIPVGNSTGTFYYQDTLTEDTTLYFGGNGLFADNWYNINIVAGPQVRTLVEGPSIIETGVCSSAFKVTTADQYYNPSSVTSNTNVTLSTTGATQFFSDPGCTSSLPSNVLAMAASSGPVLFYLKDLSSETATVTATIAGDVSAGQFKLLSSTTSHQMLVAVGSGSVCAVVDGIVKCWGSNYNGQLGNGTNTDSLTPVTVSGLTGVTQIAASTSTYCALNGSGIWCWGNGGYGELGNTAWFTQSNVPVQVPGFDGTVQKIAGPANSWGGGTDGFCAINAAGTVYCWINQSIIGNQGPQPVILPGPAIDVSVQGYDAHACAVIQNGTVYCWGFNGGGQLGDGTTVDSLTTPVQVLGISSGATAVAALESSTCAIVNGGLTCWGVGDQLYSLVAQDQGFPGTVAQITATHESVMVTKPDGSLWYQGWSDAPWVGYSGDGGGGSFLPPNFGESLITSGAQSASIAIHGGCAVVNGAGGQPSVQCWNIDRQPTYGMLGDGTTGTTYSPFWIFSLE